MTIKKTPRWETIEQTNPSGSVQLLHTATGRKVFYWRYAFKRKQSRILIGDWDTKLPPRQTNPSDYGYSKAGAVVAGQQLAKIHHDYRFKGGIATYLDEQKAQHSNIQAEAQELQKWTLKALLQDYVKHLEKIGRASHREANSIFNLHVLTPWEKIAELPANTITPEHVVDMMRRLQDDGKGRTANKLRSYLMSAFNHAKNARGDASIPVRFTNYKVTTNPVEETSSIASANRSAKDPLTAKELIKYWQLLENVDGIKGAVLKFHLLSGGQRIAQLCRLQPADIKSDYFILYDGKGNRTAEKAHTLPITPAIKEVLNSIPQLGEYVFSTTGGNLPVSGSTLSGWANEIVQNEIENFQLKRVRSGVETYLSSRGVSKDIRGRLQSHGIGGVQDRHYDAYDKMKELRQALALLEQLLTNTKATVIELNQLVS